MTKNNNYGKITAVAFITILIWVWADLALDEQFTVSNAKITVAKSPNAQLWVSFNDEPSISIRNISFTGPASRIAEVRRKTNEGSLTFEFFLAAEQHNITGPGEHTINLLEIIKNSAEIKQLGLTAEACKPEKVTVNAVKLVKKTLTIKCIDSDQNPVKTSTTEPAQIEALVPVDWSGEKLIARIQLTTAEIDQARLAPVKKTPYIELTAGQYRDILTPVKITTPAQEDLLRTDTIKNTTLGVLLSPVLQGNYKVEIFNLNEVLRPIAIRATPEAKRAYENMPYQVILQINDSDKETASTEPLRTELIYNFPREYLRKNEILLNQQPDTARFKLAPLTTDGPDSPTN